MRTNKANKARRAPCATRIAAHSSKKARKESAAAVYPNAQGSSFAQCDTIRVVGSNSGTPTYCTLFKASLSMASYVMDLVNKQTGSLDLTTKKYI